MFSKPLLNQVLEAPGSAFFADPCSTYSYLFSNPQEVLKAADRKSLSAVFSKTEKLISKGLQGFILAEYEAGYIFIDKLKSYSSIAGNPPVKIFLYKAKDTHRFKNSKLDFYSREPDQKYSINSFRLNTTKKEYSSAVNKIRKYIKEGDTYQVNYTVKGKFRFKGNPLALFSSLLFNQSACYSAFINDDGHYIISISPELFFETEAGKIITRPMKGTVKRGILPGEDTAQSEYLLNSEKERSENLMIVDLLRNDLGRICSYGSVKTKKLFRTEKYETLFQMISEIHGKLIKRTNLNEILNGIFPCGSVTGAPKISTMEIIHSLEKEKRGIYTGSIGLLLPDKKIFNVAIRTLKINKSTGLGEIGLGSGIVWDSSPAEEYEEVHLKSRFLTNPDPYFELFETMLLNNGEVLFLEEHLKRIEYSAEYFLFRMDKKKIRKKIINEIEKSSIGKYRLRLFLSKAGRIKINLEPFTPFTGEVKVILSEQRNYPKDKFLYHKTTNRKIYSAEYEQYKQDGFFDVIYLNGNDEVCEGAVSNIFIKKGGSWCTPKTECGLLPGIFRNFLLSNMPDVSEKIISRDELFSCDEMILVNSLRGKTKAAKLYADWKWTTW